MRTAYNFVINQIGDHFVAVPVGDDISKFNGFLKLNESAAYIIECLSQDITRERLNNNVAEHFACELDEATKNVEKIIDSLRKSNLIVE